MSRPSILVCAGEVSGDSHGAKLIEQLKKKRDISVYSLGGRKMAAVSDYLEEDITGRAAVGFLEVLRSVPFFYRLEKRICNKYFHNDSPDRVSAIVLIDYPGFNIRLGKAAASLGIPVYYYITPQVWAWGKKRIATLSRMCRRLYCVFDFEKELFCSAGGAAEFVGHPLVEDVPPFSDISRLDRECRLDPAERVLAVLPGSRIQEVMRHLPVIMKAASHIGMVPVIARPDTIGEEFYKNMIGPEIRITDDSYALLRRASAAVVKSGTSTLEAALSGVPFVTVYRVSGLSYAIAKRLVNVPYICMANILAGEEVSPELLQADLTPSNISAAVLKVLDNSETIKKKLNGVVSRLGHPGASKKTADSILSTLESNQ